MFPLRRMLQIRPAGNVRLSVDKVIGVVHKWRHEISVDFLYNILSHRHAFSFYGFSVSTPKAVTASILNIFCQKLESWINQRAIL